MADLPQTWRTPEYKKTYSKLDPNVKEACKIAFKKWRDNPDALSIKPLNKVFGSNEAVSAEISYSIRALGYHNKKKNEYVWFWVGSHEEYNNKISKNFLKAKIDDIKDHAITREKREEKEKEILNNDNFIGLKKPNLRRTREQFNFQLNEEQKATNHTARTRIK